MTRGILLLSLMLAGCPANERADDTPDSAEPDVATTDLGTRDLAGPTPDSPPDATPDAATTGRPAVRTVESTCPMGPIDDGTTWTGWANLQFPALLELDVGEVSDPVFGQVWQEGGTDQPGMANGWQAQLMVGPLGTNPVDSPGCFRALDAEFNVDSGNNDEWWVRLKAPRAGLWGMFTRYRPPNGAWLYGDLNGSDDGVSSTEAGVLAVDDPAGPAEIHAVTLNLRCRTDQWDARFDIMIDALVAADPHILGFQEDCATPGGTPQSTEIAARLADRLDRGFEVFRMVTHQADHPEGTFDEGIALLSAFPVDAQFAVDLPYVTFPRQALVVDVRLGGGAVLRVINTHLEFGGANDDIRAEEATAIVGQLGAGPTIVTGDFNAEPDSPAYAVLNAALSDTWSDVGVGVGNTMPAPAPTRRIDYIWTLGLTPQVATIVDGEVGGVHLSDHVGISATFIAN